MPLMRVQIVTPEGRVLDASDATRVDLPGVAGALGILPGHAPLFAAIGVGEARVFLSGGEVRAFAVAGGWAQVEADAVRLLLTFVADESSEEEGEEAACLRAREALESYGALAPEIIEADVRALRAELARRRKRGRHEQVE
jgi:F-type H+-transporting ATPase subunit epsilon